MSALTEYLYNNKLRLQDRFDDVRWLFIPARSPNKGGFYERMIGLFKRAYEAVLPHRDWLTDQELLTVVGITEGYMNDRPLCYESNDAGDPRAICPNDFIGAGRAPCLVPTRDNNILGKMWTRMQSLLDNLWTRFINQTRSQMNQNLRKPSEAQKGALTHLLPARSLRIVKQARPKQGAILSLFRGRRQCRSCA